jgi:GH24 family phage-related lysozyme (muramidase)
MRLGDRGADLIKSFEGFRSCPYRDAVGVWTIGYGSTKGVGPTSRCISRAEAERRMRAEIDATYGQAVNALGLPLNQNQFDALTSFVYNVGPGALAASTGIGQALRKRQWRRAGDELLRWNRAGGRELAGLTRRRRAERELFLRREDPLRHYPPRERGWIREYDRLRRQDRDPGRRRALRRLMTERRKQIWRKAQTDGWDGKHRRARYNSLKARTA